MPSFEEIQQMSDEQVAAANKKLVRKLVLTKIVLPVAVTAAVIVVAKIVDKKLGSTEEN
jgi:multisubunit Na+/H+ antiporter MnhC subunit